ncbi:MAG: methionine gamma-lyase family protein [Erysipelotrichaceae bacterium]|nr:methionine gamma-lyase family protein [Erysipelotrichaceae bacterium]
MMIDLIDSEILELNKKADEDLKDVFDELDRICLINSERVLSAFIENQVSYTDFADINGYGNYDAGRNKLEKIFATVLGCEDALVRPQIMSGTNALYLAFSAMLKHGDTMISLTGMPYDSLQEMGEYISAYLRLVTALP